jgi:hypothetical protein
VLREWAAMSSLRTFEQRAELEDVRSDDEGRFGTRHHTTVKAELDKIVRGPLDANRLYFEHCDFLQEARSERADL